MNKSYKTLIQNLFLLFFLCCCTFVEAQIFKENFNSLPTSYPYPGVPAPINANLSTPQWSNTSGMWSTTAGASGQALLVNTPTGNSSITLTIDVASGYMADITHFDIWTRKSPTGPVSWDMTINGIAVGGGTATVPGGATGQTPVSNPVIGLTGRITVVINLINSGVGNFRIDDFALYGRIVPNCTGATVNSFSPASGPENTQVTFTGSGFNAVTAVTFDGIPATFTIVSDNTLTALVPIGTTTGNILINTGTCPATLATSFSVLTPMCGNPNIYISELFDKRTDSDGAIELYNPTPNDIVFGGQYVLERYRNVGNANTTETLVLQGTIRANSTYLVKSGPAPCNVTFDASIGSGINENNEFKIRWRGDVIDVARAPSYIGYTVIRRPAAVAPKTTYAAADWNISGARNESCTDLNRHTATPPAGSTPSVANPVSVTICDGTNTSFTSGVTGTGYTYQWKTLNSSGNWVNVTNNTTFGGATTNTLTVNNATATLNNTQYYCFVTSVTCTLYSDAALLTVGGLPAPTVTVTQATCSTGGQAVVTAPTGTGITYSINGGTFGTSATFSPLTPGNYNIVSKNATGCTSAPFNFTINIAPGAPATPTLTLVQPTCTISTGTITVSNILAGAQYQLNTGAFQSTPSFSGLTPGAYTVTVRDTGGCTATSASVTINAAPSAPATPTLTLVQATCTTATGTITVSNVLAGAQYQLNTGAFQTTSSFSGLTPGTYTITVRDAGGCTATSASVTINTAPAAPAVPTLTLTQPTCTTTTGTITVSNVLAGAQYQLNSGAFQSTPSFSGLTPGAYTVTVRDAGGCTATSASVTINAAPSAPTVPTLTLTQPTCTTATGTITVSNVLAGAQYQLNSGAFQSTPSFAGVTPGAYTVTVRDAGGCTATSASVTINAAPSAPATPTLTLTQPTCTTATGTITVSNVLAGAQYQLNTGAFQTTPSFGTLTPGTYTVTIRDAGGCTATSASVTINAAPSAPATPTLALTQPTCTTATGTITVSNVLAGAQYQLNTGAFQSTPSFATLTPGTYTVTVRDAGGCTATSASVTINAAPSAPATPTLALTQPTCTTATGTITVSNVLTGAQYQLNTGAFQSTPSFATLTPGTYTVTVRDAGGCTATSASVTINTAPAAPAVPILALTQPTCTTATGTITVSNVLVGAQYQLNSGAFQSTPSFSGLTPGAYTVTVRDAGGCTATSASVTINAAPSAPATPTLALTQPTCTIATGTITVSNVLVGAQYQLNSGAFQSTPSFAGVTPGTYTVTVRDAGGCTATSASVTINPVSASYPALPLLSLVQPTCSVNTGSITITNPEPGTEYRVNGGVYQTATQFNLLPPGNYTIVARNAGGCTTTSGSVSIFTAPVVPSAPLSTVTQSDCITRTGTITVTSPIGTDLQYRLNTGGYQNSPVFTNVPAGTYTIIVRNANGCFATSANIIINAAPVIAPPIVSSVEATCTVPTGSISVTAPTGAGYQYSINGGAYQPTPQFSNLLPGTYTVTALDVNGCTSNASAVIFANPATPPTPVIADVQPNCSVATGTLTVTAPLGTGYRYSINGGTLQTSPMFRMLAPGTYTVTVRNSAGCESFATATINAQPGTPANPVLTAVQPQCGDTTGSITVTSPTGGYTYSINGKPYQTSATFTLLTAGNYTIIAKNAAGCVSTPENIRINAAPLTPAVPLLTVVQPTCAVPHGTITVVSPAGAGYTYSINGTTFQSGLVFTNLSGGSYTITVKNSTGCTAVSLPQNIDTPPAPAPSAGTITGNNTVCADATLQLANTVTGGIWSSSNTTVATVDANGLVTPVHAGTAIIRYTMGTTCPSETSMTITINPLPYIRLTNVFLCVDNKTQAVISPKTLSTGLNDTDYTFVWEVNGRILPDTTATIQVNEAGQYTVTATTIATGCTDAATATVGISSIALATAEVGQDFSQNQVITVNVTGGSGDYVFTLDHGPFQTSPVFRGVEQGEHLVTVYDANGCGRLDLPVFALDYPRFFTPNNDGNNDTWKIAGLSAQFDARIYIYDRFGKLISTLLPNSGIGWDGTLNGYPLPATDYWFSVLYKSSNGQQKEFRAHFSLLR